MSTRDQATAYLLEQLRYIQDNSTATADHAHAAIPGCDGTTWALGDLTDRRDMHNTVAVMCEQIIEDITGSGLLDRLEAEDRQVRAAANAASTIAAGDRVTWLGDLGREPRAGTVRFVRDLNGIRVAHIDPGVKGVGGRPVTWIVDLADLTLVDDANVAFLTLTGAS